MTSSLAKRLILLALLITPWAQAQKISTLPVYPQPLVGTESIPASNTTLSTTQSYQITPNMFQSFMEAAALTWTAQQNFSGAMVAGTPTGGAEGAGTLNAVGLYVNGTAVPTVGGANTWTGPQTFSNSVVLGTATGGALGAGTLNAQALYVNGTVVPALSTANTWTAQQTVSASIVVGSPSGGSEGTGTVNAQALYSNGVPVTLYSHVDSFTATSGQTSFVLSATPVLANAAIVVLSGAVLTPTTDYSIAGTTVTLVNGALAGQTLVVRY